MKTPPEPSQLLIGISHREMLNVMADAGIFCGVDKFRRVLQWAQQHAIEWAAEAEQRALAAQEAEKREETNGEMV